MRSWETIETFIKEHSEEHLARLKFTAIQFGHAWENIFVEWWRDKGWPNPQRWGEIVMILVTLILLILMPIIGPIALIVGFAIGGFNE